MKKGMELDGFDELDEEFRKLIELAENGDEDSMRRLFEKFGPSDLVQVDDDTE